MAGGMGPNMQHPMQGGINMPSMPMPYSMNTGQPTVPPVSHKVFLHRKK